MAGISHKVPNSTGSNIGPSGISARLSTHTFVGVVRLQTPSGNAAGPSAAFDLSAAVVSLAACLERWAHPWSMNIQPYFVIHFFSLLWTPSLIPMIFLGSEAMSLVQLFVPTEVAHDTVAELGELGNVEFKDVRVFLVSRFFPSCSSLRFRSSTPM